MTTTRHACAGCGRMLDYQRHRWTDAYGPAPYAYVGTDDDGDPWYAYVCECGHRRERAGVEPPALPTAAVEAIERDAYERGRRDERAAVVAWLLQRQDAATRRRPMMLTPRLENLITGQILEAGDAAAEIRDGHHQTTHPDPSSKTDGGDDG